jgi:hypothetical protein
MGFGTWNGRNLYRAVSFTAATRKMVGKPEGKRPLGRPRRRWVDNIRMDLQEVGCGDMDWIGLAGSLMPHTSAASIRLY